MSLRKHSQNMGFSFGVLILAGYKHDFGRLMLYKVFLRYSGCYGIGFYQSEHTSRSRAPSLFLSSACHAE